MSRRPLYWRLLRLRHVRPNAWQRALLGEGALALAAVLVLADLATAWTLLVFPLAVAVVVKAHDLLEGVLRHTLRGVAEGVAPDSATATGAAATTGTAGVTRSSGTTGVTRSSGATSGSSRTVAR